MSKPRLAFLGWLLFSAAAVGMLGTIGWQQSGPSPVTNPNWPAIQAAAPESVPPQGFTPPLFGYEPQPEKTREFIRSLPQPYASQAPGLMRDGPKTQVLLYRALYEAYAAHNAGAQWQVKAQGIGDCVSWGWAHGLDVHLAVMWKLGETSEWRPAATEAIYGGSRVESRGGSFGGWGDGSYGGAAAKWVKDWGAVFRQDYTDPFGFDLTTYSASRAKQWGAYGNGGQGDGGKFDSEAKRHPVRSVVVVRNFEEAAAAISAGYPVPVCSGQGFSRSRDKDGFSRAAGSWAHCMCFIGVRYDRPGLLCLNSWGPDWIGGPKWPEDQPDGSFWVEAATASRMLSGEDSFAVSGYEGFPYRDLKHGDWVQTSPGSVRDLGTRIALDWSKPRQQPDRRFGGNPLKFTGPAVRKVSHQW